jgi:hypothetical protein
LSHSGGEVGLISDGRSDVLEQSADLAGDFIAFDGRVDSSALCVSEDIQDFCAEDAGAEFEAADIFTAGHISGDACDEQISEALIEDDFNGDSGVSAAKEGGEGLLPFCQLLNSLHIPMFGQRFSGCKALIAVVQLFEGIGWGDVGGGSWRGGGGSRLMSEPAGGGAGGSGEALSEERPSAVCVVLTVADFRVGSAVSVHVFPFLCVVLCCVV